jgi:hypothetical protein
VRNIPLLNTPQGRAGNDASCANCGKRLRPKRASRRMRFCGDACRQSAFGRDEIEGAGADERGDHTADLGGRALNVRRVRRPHG